MQERSGIPIRRSNTILYCHAWSETVQFYQGQLGLPVTLETDWFVEFQLAEWACVSIADARRATVGAGQGRGITLSWQVDRLSDVQALLHERGVESTSIQSRWGAQSLFIKDPEGHRIELWQAK